MTRLDLARSSDAELVSLVASKNEFLSRHARRLLQARAHERGLPPALHDTLRRQWGDAPDTPARLRALWTLHVTGGLDARTARDGLRSDDEWTRAWTLQLAFESVENLQRLLGEAAEAGLPADPTPGRLAATDPSPLVRLYLAAAAQRAPNESVRADMVRGLLTRAEDRDDHNLPLMVWFAMEPWVADHPPEALAAALATPLPRILEFTTRRIASLGTPEARHLVATRLGALEDPTRQRAMLTGLEAALRGERHVPMPTGWDAVEARLGASTRADIRTLAQTLSLTFGSPAALATLRQALGDAAAPAGVRRAALDALLRVRDAHLPDRLLDLLGHPALRAAALRALATYNDPRTPGAILAVYAELDGGQKRDALGTLVSRVAYARALLAAVDAGRVPTQDLTAELVRQLRSHKDEPLQAELTRLYGVAREASADKQAEIARFRNLYHQGGSQPGNASRGREVFDRICAQCHVLFDEGGLVGPNITGANRSDLNYLLETILDPNAVIPNEYQATEIETHDGRILSGIVKSRDDRVVVLQTANELVTILREDIAQEVRSSLSMMPEGLLEGLSDQAFRDLIYYLSRPGQVPRPPDAAR
ncbi:MAG: c-type cytochrome [Verrucomicrobiales bacterium]|nr:c-type cytochrome [Verrucomicrobiales bacterium]